MFNKHPLTVQKPYIFEATEQNFSKEVLLASERQLILVDFWAEWCAPCQVLTPILEKLVQEYQGKWLLAKIETDENMKLAGRYKLRGFPTVLAFKKGEIIAHFSGAKPVHWIRDFLSQCLEN